MAPTLTKTMPHLKLFTDGSSLGNPGPGGFAFAVFDDQQLIYQKAYSSASTTNNRMEMAAMAEGLKFLASNYQDQKIQVYSDSSLVLNTITKNWKRNTNLDIWERVDAAIVLCKKQNLQINYNWVKGHAGNIGNELVDKLAQKAAREIASKNNNNRGKITTPKPSPSPLRLDLHTEPENNDLRAKITEQTFLCGNCQKATKGHLSQKSPTSPVRVDCLSCNKYIKFAKLVG